MTLVEMQPIAGKYMNSFRKNGLQANHNTKTTPNTNTWSQVFVGSIVENAANSLLFVFYFSGKELQARQPPRNLQQSIFSSPY